MNISSTTIFKEDVQNLVKFVKGNKDHDRKLQLHNVICAALRMFTVLGAVFGALATLYAFSLNPLTGVLLGAGGIGYIALNYDLFMILKNYSSYCPPYRPRIYGTDILGNKTCINTIQGQQLLEVLFKNTIFSPAWYKIAQLAENLLQN